MKQELEEKQGHKWLQKSTLIAILLGIFGALLYGATIFHYGYLQNMQRGENGRVAIQMLDQMRRPFFRLKKAEALLSQSTDDASAISDIKSAIYEGRQLLLRYLKLANYNEKLRENVMQLKLSYETWVALELELVNKKMALETDLHNNEKHAEYKALSNKNLFAFLTVMDELSRGEKSIHEDIKAGALAVRGLIVSTLVFAAFLIGLIFWLLLSNARSAKGHYKTVLELSHLSRTDSLTGLPNRIMLDDRFSVAIAGARRYDHCVGVLYLDIDKFKEVNDKMGHQAGDFVLKKLALRLQRHIRESDTAARVGGDEFIVLLTNLQNKADARIAADKIQTELNKPFRLNGEQYSPCVSIGIAIFPYDGLNPEQLLHHADSAMYKAKQTTKSSTAL